MKKWIAVVLVALAISMIAGTAAAAQGQGRAVGRGGVLPQGPISRGGGYF